MILGSYPSRKAGIPSILMKMKPEDPQKGLNRSLYLSLKRDHLST